MEPHMTQQVPMSQDAALVVALAGTAMPFAHSREDEAERWLRTMRLHGQVGATLQALGVGEAPLMTGSAPALAPERAAELAAARRAENVTTADLLFAVMDVYGKLFDRALYLRGTSRDELAERLAGSPGEASA